MGCPAKKVCNVWAGSALMRNEPLALAIVDAVVAACAPRGVPVTLKMRTGWCDSERNALRAGARREGAGIAMLTVHGRTREQGYRRPGRARHRGRREGRAEDPGGGQRRHRFAPPRRARCCATPAPTR
jgi:tRNA-dihydrouridine synthase